MKKHFIALIAALALPLFASAQTTEVKKPNYRIGVCDWMVLKRQKTGAFKLAHQIDADGVEMDMGGLGKRDSFDNKLRAPKQVAEFKHHLDSFRVEVGDIAMSGFYGQSLVKKDSYKWLAEDCLNTMKEFTNNWRRYSFSYFIWLSWFVCEMDLITFFSYYLW